MRKFTDFNITQPEPKFVGDKLKIDRILNREIEVLDYKIGSSKFERGNGKCLTLQIKIGETKHVVFVGSASLMETIKQIPENQLPFQTTIQKAEDGRLIFT